MTQLTIDLNALCEAYEHGSWSRRFYLDSISGAIVEVTETQRIALQAIYDEEGEESANIPPALQHAHTVELDDDRFWKIPTCTKKALMQLCNQFSETVERPLQRLLWRALDAHDVGWFERMLGMESAELHRWQQHKQAAHQQTLTNWRNQITN